jgi:hypothetical protein
MKPTCIIINNLLTYDHKKILNLERKELNSHEA